MIVYIYNGTRWFFNNDDLIKKNSRYHIIVNMSSVRCDGIESATGFADAYNFCTTDGSTLFQKNGNEYRPIFGAFDATAFPGVTAREGMDRLTPVTNWRGYCSKHNFAAAATLGGENAVAGYIFEKMNASNKKGVNDKGDLKVKNEVLYNVKAYKSYFMLGDYTVCLGAGITNLDPVQPGHIRTTIDQTEHTGQISVMQGKKGVKWLMQENGFAYSVFPNDAARMKYTTETRKTEWTKMNYSNIQKKGLPEKVDVLQIWIDHGQAPVNDNYGYVVYAGDNSPAKEYPFQVLRNDTLVQAVASNDETIIEAVFYNPTATLKHKKLQLSVSAPCAVLIEKRQKDISLSVTDACMNPNCRQITVTYCGKVYTLNMPQGNQCGKPAIYK